VTWPSLPLFYPVLVWPHARFPGEIVVTDWTSGEDIVITGDEAELDSLTEVLWRCDGNHALLDLEGVVAASSWPVVLDALCELTGRHALIDRHDRAEFLLAQLHGRGSVPAEALEEITRESRWRDPRAATEADTGLAAAAPLAALSRPHSTPFRAEVAWRPVPRSAVQRILAESYGSDGIWKPVPSAGRLWPLTVHAAIRCDDSLTHELAWFDDEAGTLQSTDVRLKAADLAEILAQGPDMQPLLEAGSAMLLISAHMGRSARKYGNRSAAYALIESGCLLQQAILCAAQFGISCRPIGGIRANLARELVGDAPVPLLTVLLSSLR